ncbi:MAG: hypothetical protein IPP38_11140 [Bacteroidetes bacterium]|nr:hypothetical protein [Bacteroidota bacterium]
MISLEEAKKILSKAKRKYSDKEVLQVLSAIEALVKIELEINKFPSKTMNSWKK